jgi:hypothetical protein
MKFFAWQTRRKRGNFEDLSVDGRLILKWIVMKQDGKGWTRFIGFGIGTLIASILHSQ